MKAEQDILTVAEVASELRISKSKTYDFLREAEKRGYFPVLRIGRAIRIPARPFYKWREGGEVRGKHDLERMSK